MRRNFTLLLLTFSSYCFCQENLKAIRTSSRDEHAYRISAAQAEYFRRIDSIPINQFLSTRPYRVFQKDSFNTALLPRGIYVLIYLDEENLKAKVEAVSGLRLLTINNKDHVQLSVLDEQGNFVPNAVIYVNGRKAAFNPQSQTFAIDQRNPDDAFVKVYTPTDTLYSELAKDEEPDIDRAEQLRNNYRKTMVFKILKFLPAKARSLFASKSKIDRRNSFGYIAFNQPRYKLSDTVKFKGYLLNGAKKQNKKPVTASLSYFRYGKQQTIFLKKILPASPGAYVGEFALTDSLPADAHFNLTLATAKNQLHISEHFKTEDYVLPTVSKYNFNLDKTAYYFSDTIRAICSAEDANGLGILDATARLIFTTSRINFFYRDSLYVMDTLYDKEIDLLSAGDTKFNVPADIFPAADLQINATLIFRNSANELQEKNEEFSLLFETSEIKTSTVGDSVRAEFIINGKSQTAAGWLSRGDKPKKKIQFPFTENIDPFTEEYNFQIILDNNEFNKTYQAKRYYVYTSQFFGGDTAGITLSNPKKIKVWFTVFDNQKIIARGSDSSETISWFTIPRNPRKVYLIRYQYFWNNSEQTEEQTFATSYQRLQMKLDLSPTVYPGRKDSLKVLVTDFRGKPAGKVNLTAVGYNNQFGAEANAPHLPQISKYKAQRTFEKSTYEHGDDLIVAETDPLFYTPQWLKKFGADTMTFYRFIFPANGMYDHATLQKESQPAVSINAVKKGVPQEIYLLYINRELVYYNGVTSQFNYAFRVYTGLSQIGIRTRDAYYEIDNVYFQPYYKHDISIDLDNLPPYARREQREIFWTAGEKQLLEKQILRINNGNSSSSWLWQGERVLNLRSNNEKAGPFQNQYLTYFQPDNFDIDFRFEPGYSYRLSKAVVRLEKDSLFPHDNKRVNLPITGKTFLKLGDTIPAAPQIKYPVWQSPKNFLTTSSSFYGYNGACTGCGNFRFALPKDSAFYFVILKPADRGESYSFYYRSGEFANIPAGKYTMTLLTNHYSVLQAPNFEIRKNAVLCLDLSRNNFRREPALIDSLDLAYARKQKEEADRRVVKPAEVKDFSLSTEYLFTTSGGGSLRGLVVDEKGGKPVPYVSIRVLGFRAATATSEHGDFLFKNLRAGKYILRFASVDYEKLDFYVDVVAGKESIINIRMQSTGAMTLSTVQVVSTGALGLRRQPKELGYAATTLSTRTLVNGKVSSVAVTTDSGVFDDFKIRIRGIRSLTGDNSPLIIIDGIPASSMANIRPEMIVSQTVLSGAAAVAIYGSEALNGVILITTSQKTLRKDFRDYSIWIPNLITDKSGKASAAIEYPDNITGWKTFVFGMDKKRRMVYKAMLVQAFKPVSAQLSIPTFLIEGDRVTLSGKALNYTDEEFSLVTSFAINDSNAASNTKSLAPHSASPEQMSISASGTDTIKIKYGLQTTTGFRDAEERKIPVQAQGTEEAIGSFAVLKNDSTLQVVLPEEAGDKRIYAQSNTLDILLDELRHLREYPFYCMEQTTSKLLGLEMEKNIREKLKEKFTDAKQMQFLLRKILKAQSYDGGWSWWEGGENNLRITVYITRALLNFSDKTLTEKAVTNAAYYLTNKLPFLQRGEFIDALCVLSESQRPIDFRRLLSSLPFDSLSVIQKWQVVKIMQEQQINFDNQLADLIKLKQETMTGGEFWGEETYRWYDNRSAASVIACNVLKKLPAFKKTVDKLLQFFLEERRNGFWQNTVESASILNEILSLPEINENFKADAVLTCTGDTNFTCSNFPLEIKLRKSNIQNLTFKKSGGGIIYLTNYSKTYKTAAPGVANNFIVKTEFIQDKSSRQILTAGKKVTIRASAEALKDAQNVLIEIPIPAGCVLTNKNSNEYGVYKEYRKDKILIFVETMKKGIHTYEAEAEVRFSGRFCMNPAKAELMYFPTIFGRNEEKQVTIR